MFNSALARLGAVLRSRLVRDDEGATAVEYGLIVGLIAIAIIAAVITLGGTLEGLFTSVNTEISENLPD